MIEGLYFKVRKRTTNGLRAQWNGSRFSQRTSKTWTTYKGALAAAHRAIAYNVEPCAMYIDAYNSTGHRIDTENIRTRLY